MKKIMTIALRILVIIVSVLYNFVVNIVHGWSLTTYNLTAEFIVNLSFLVLSAVLLGISIVMFPLKSKMETEISIAVMLIGLVIGFSFLNIVGVPYLTIFACSIYITELICRCIKKRKS